MGAQGGLNEVFDRRGGSKDSQLAKFGLGNKRQQMILDTPTGQHGINLAGEEEHSWRSMNAFFAGLSPYLGAFVGGGNQGKMGVFGAKPELHGRGGIDVKAKKDWLVDQAKKSMSLMRQAGNTNVGSLRGMMNWISSGLGTVGGAASGAWNWIHGGGKFNPKWDIKDMWKSFKTKMGDAHAKVMNSKFMDKSQSPIIKGGKNLMDRFHARIFQNHFAEGKVGNLIKGISNRYAMFEAIKLNDIYQQNINKAAGGKAVPTESIHKQYGAAVKQGIPQIKTMSAAHGFSFKILEFS